MTRGACNFKRRGPVNFPLLFHKFPPFYQLFLPPIMLPSFSFSSFSFFFSILAKFCYLKGQATFFCWVWGVGGRACILLRFYIFKKWFPGNNSSKEEWKYLPAFVDCAVFAHGGTLWNGKFLSFGGNGSGFWSQVHYPILTHGAT